MLAFVLLSIVLLAVIPYALNSVGGLSAFVEKAGTQNGSPPFALFYTNEPNTSGAPTGFAGYVGILGFIYMMAAWFSVALVFFFKPLVDGYIWGAIYIASVPAFVLSFIALISVSLLTRRSCPPKGIRDVDGNDVSDTPLFDWRR